ncbi:MAG: enoyl-[acyl-carrier-protein] reductase FabI [Acidobacteria bacterium]|nr:MAG: enoyl-[acyl-carrier-protein] reductase FabI [Acidobacteriota bacterium]REK01015.1 MAG: enoyl-[acyl-carrier-protein] reductase FabI [Acidobacteriota bacterium]
MSDENETSTEEAPLTVSGRLLEGKRGLVVGVANQRSIAWGIARAAAAHGAELAFTFQGDALEKRVRPLAASLESEIVEELDVTDDEQMRRLFELLRERWGQLDFLVHSVAFADRQDLQGRTIDTSREGFLKALEISAYSLISLSRAAEPLMTGGGSILAMTYLGSVQAVPNYNVMGIAKAALESAIRYLALDLGPAGVRVNGISAGPIKTLAASGVSGLRGLLSQAAERAPLKRNVDIDDVGRAGVYLASDLSSGTTGEILYVDAGLNVTAW